GEDVAVPPVIAAPVCVDAGVPEQVPFVKNWNVTVPVSGNESLVVIWAVSNTPAPLSSAVPLAMTPPPDALCRVVAVAGVPLLITNGSHVEGVGVDDVGLYSAFPL